MKKFLLVIVGLFIVLLGGAIIYWETMDTNVLKAQLTKYASQKLGRTLTIAGDLKPSFSLTSGFGLTVQGVSLANAKGFAPENMFSLNELQLVVNPFAFLHHQIQINKLVIDKADVTMESRGAVNNWSFADAANDKTNVAPPASEPAAPAMQIGIDSVTANDLSLTKITDGERKVYKIDELTLQAALSKPVKLDLKASADGKPITLKFQGGTLAEIQGGEKQPLDIDLDYAPHHLTLKADYRRSGDTHQLTDIDATYNDIKVTGTMALNLAGSVPDVQMDIAIPQLDIAKLQGKDSSGGSGSGSKAAPSEYVFSRDPLPWQQLKAANVNAKIDIKQLLNDGKNMGPADMQARLQSGVLVSSVIAQPPGAGKPITLKANASAAKQLSLALSAPSLEPSLLLGDNPIVKAPASLVLELAGAGNSLHDVMAGSNGRFALDFAPGTINASALPVAAKGALASVVGLDQIDGAKLACTKVDFNVANGVATAQGIGVDSVPLIAAGDGTVNLGAETVNLRLVAEPEVAVAKGARFPIYIKGGLKSPTTMVDTAAITQQIANAAAGKAIKLINNDQVAGLADALLGRSKQAAANDYAKMPFNPCRPNDVDKAPAPAAQPAAATTTQQQPAPTLKNLKKDPAGVLKGLFGQ